MDSKLLETYFIEIDSKKIEIVLREVVENGDILYYAKSNYKNVSAISKTIEEARKKCEDAIILKAQIISGKVKLMKNNDAEAIAKEYFRNYFENRVIPKEIAQNLTTSMSNNGKDYIVEVEYFDKTKIAQIDETLFKTFPDVMVTIRVDRETGEVTLIESPNIKW